LLTVGAGKLAVTVPADALLLPVEDDWTAAYRTARFRGDHDARIARWCLEQIGVQRRHELGFQNVALAEWVRDGAVLDAEICDG
jgi:hypothetical protein